MSQEQGVSSYGLLALAIGVVLSVATTCGPSERLPQLVPDTGGGGGAVVEEEIGYTVDTSTAFALHGEGDSVVRTVHVTLTADCLAEVEAYAWGYPTGWAVMGVSLEQGTAPGDTGGADTGADTGADSGADSAGDSGGGETGAPDTAVDTGMDTATDTGALDTGAVDTGVIDTGVIDTATDTGAADTGVIDTATDTASLDTADTGPPPDARFRVNVVRNDGLVVLDDGFGLYGEEVTHAFASDLEAFRGCVRDLPCERTWEVRVTLTQGEDAYGDLGVHSRIQMCSSGPGDAADISVTVD
ncbi:MAG: hypothetical protein Q8P41_16160 [Pseudomonadota bacterium]|nr:hypothetical protein [Pseudomonadota bacterium]